MPFGFFSSSTDTEQKPQQKPPRDYTADEIAEHKAKYACNVCKDKGERSVGDSIIPAQDSKLASQPANTQLLITQQPKITEPKNSNKVEEKSDPNCRCLAYQNSPCPLNRRELGRASWAYLHTLAAYYPDNPTTEQQDEMRTFIKTYAKLYPCGYCADMTSDEMIRKPPQVQSRQAFQFWMCGIHNEVNSRMGKPIFNCNKVDQRWRTGPPDGSCE